MSARLVAERLLDPRDFDARAAIRDYWPEYCRETAPERRGFRTKPGRYSFRAIQEIREYSRKKLSVMRSVLRELVRLARRQGALAKFLREHPETAAIGRRFVDGWPVWVVQLHNPVADRLVAEVRKRFGVEATSGYGGFVVVVPVPRE